MLPISQRSSTAASASSPGVLKGTSVEPETPRRSATARAMSGETRRPHRPRCVFPVTSRKVRHVDAGAKDAAGSEFGTCLLEHRYRTLVLGSRHRISDRGGVQVGPCQAR